MHAARLLRQACAAACVQPGRNFWEIYRLFNIHDLRFDGVYFPGILHQVCLSRHLLASLSSGMSHQACSASSSSGISG
jgi:hypothetical protein